MNENHGYSVTRDEIYMKRAVDLAWKGCGWVNPNPMVGAVLERDGRIIGTGFHEYFGGPHAEINAINAATEEVNGATLYVTLEPCNHHGKTPPCTNTIIEKGIRKVVIGINDPNPMVCGKGTGSLMSHGIEVVTGILGKTIQNQNEFYLKYITTGLPFVILKTAMTLDGKIATVAGESRWITSDASRRLVHRMRHDVSAVMVGVDTVLLDDPVLDVRLRKNMQSRGGWRNPLKVIPDSQARIPLTSKLIVNNPQLTLIATTHRADKNRVKEVRRTGAQVIVCEEKDGKVDLGYLMQALAAMGIDSVMIEGGSQLAFSALSERVVDKVVTFIAPKLLGGSKAPTALGGKGIFHLDEAILLRDISCRKIGQDLMIQAYLNHGKCSLE